jgi:hypothetical protein
VSTDGITSRTLLASIQNLGKRPCPRCLIPLSQAHLLGTVSDMQKRQDMTRKWSDELKRMIDNARKIIYEENKQINSTRVENLLYENSLVPTMVNLF